MAIAALLPKIHDLTRVDKVRVLHFIASELSAEEQPTLLPGSESLGAESAASDLLDFLARSNSQPA